VNNVGGITLKKEDANDVRSGARPWSIGRPYTEQDVETLIDERNDYRGLLEDIANGGFKGVSLYIHIGLILDQWNRIWRNEE
jgi:hypothetical protein